MSDFSAPVDYLEDYKRAHGEAMDMDTFIKRFNSGLFNAKGQDYIDAGLIAVKPKDIIVVEPVTEEQPVRVSAYHVKAHTRRTKSGKIIYVKGYIRVKYYYARKRKEKT